MSFRTTRRQRLYAAALAPAGLILLGLATSIIAGPSRPVREKATDGLAETVDSLPPRLPQDDRRSMNPIRPEQPRPSRTAFR